MSEYIFFPDPYAGIYWSEKTRKRGMFYVVNSFRLQKLVFLRSNFSIVIFKVNGTPKTSLFNNKKVLH